MNLSLQDYMPKSEMPKNQYLQQRPKSLRSKAARGKRTRHDQTRQSRFEKAPFACRLAKFQDNNSKRNAAKENTQNDGHNCQRIGSILALRLFKVRHGIADGFNARQGR